MEKYIRNEDLITADLDDDLVMLDIEQGTYFSLNPVGKRIWELLEQEKDLNELSSLLMEEYEVSEAECRQDLQAHVSELMQLKLINRVG